MKPVLTTAALTAALAVAPAALADGDGDLMIYDNGSGGLSFGLYDFDGGTGVVNDAGPIDIAETELEANWEGTGMPGSDEPGWATDGSSPNDPDGIAFPFPANTQLNVSVNLLPVLGGNAAYWDGTGAVNFTTATNLMPNGVIVEGAFGSEIDLDGTATAPAGTVSPWISGGDGTAHDHIEFFLDADDATAATGVYLISLSASAGALESEPLYLLMGWGGDDFTDVELEEAIELAEVYVETQIVPEPGSLALLGAAGVLLTRRRR